MRSASPRENPQLADRVEAALRAEGEGTQRLEAALEAIARAFEAPTMTLHRVASPGMLRLVASRGMPENLLAITREVPFGKGMAGLCAVRREPVTVCNLQTDCSGAARPGARESGVAGAIVVPVLEAGTGRLLGTLGIGKPTEHAYTDAERDVLSRCAQALATALDP